MLEDTEQTVNGVTINLSILDFKSIAIIAAMYVILLYKSIHIGF